MSFVSSSMNEFAISLSAEIGSIDLSSIQRVSKEFQKEFLKNLNIKVNKKNLEQAKKEYGSLTNEQLVLQKKFNSAIKSNQTEVATAIQNSLSAVSAAVAQYETKASKAGLNIDTEQSIKNKEAYMKAQASLQRLVNKEIQESATLVDRNTKNVDTNTKSIDKNSKEIKENTEAKKKNNNITKESEGFLASFNNGIKNSIGLGGQLGIGFAAGQKAVELFTQAIRYAVQEIQELNKVMIEVQMVTGETTDSIYRTFNEYNDMARELGVTTKEVAEGANDWLRQGKSAEETTKLLTASTMMSKIASMSAAEATEYMTSTLNGYKMEAEDAMHVLDAMSAVDLAAATSVDEIATSLQKTANTARDAGVTFEKLVGYIATVSETTRQAPEIIGTSFKTLFSRLENVKAGKSIDEYGESLNDVEKVLNRFDVSLRDSMYQFRDMEDVIDDIAVKWNDLTNVERSQIATAVAGVRQREIFIALMANYDKALEYEQIALNSNGKALEKYDIYLQGVEASLNELKASFEDVVYEEEYTELFKSLIKLGTSLVDVLNLLNPLIRLFADALSLVSNTLTGIINILNGKTISDWIENKDNKKIEALENQINEIKNSLEYLNNKEYKTDIDYENIKNLNIALDDAINKLNEIENKKEIENKDNEFQNFIYDDKNVSTLSSGAKENAMKYANYISGTETISDPSDLAEYAEDYKRVIELYNEILKYTDTETYKFHDGAQEFVKYVSEIVDKTSEYTKAIEQSSENTESLSDMLSNLSTEADENILKFSKLQTAIDSISGAMSAAETAMSEYNNSGYISSETALALVSSNKNFAEAITIVNGKIEINKDLIEDRIKLIKEEEAAIIQSEIDEKRAIASKIQAQIALATAYAMTGNALITMTQISNINNNEMISKLAALREEIEALEKQKELLLNWSFVGTGSSSSGSVDSAIDSKQDELEKYANAVIDRLDKEIEALEKEKDEVSNYYDDKIDAIQEEIDALDEEEEKESKLLEIEEKRAELAKAKQEVVRIYREGQGFVYETNMEKVAEAQSELDILLKEWDNYQKKLELQQQIEDFEKAKEETIADIDEQIDSLEDLKGQWSDTLDIEDEVNEYSEYLEDLRDFEEASYKDRLDMLEDFKDEWNDIVNSMKKPSPGGSSGGGGGSGSSSSKDDGFVNHNPDTGGEQIKDPTKFVGNTLDTVFEATGIKDLLKKNKYANGTKYAKRTSLSVVGEKGREIRLVRQGDSIIPNNLTENLFDWGRISPDDFVKSLSPSFNRKDSNKNYNFNFQNLVLPNVENANSFLKSLKERSMNYAIQVSSER